MNHPTVSILLSTIALCAGALVKPPEPGHFELLILHNNDMHARFEQTSRLSGACTLADREAGQCYGGFPRVAHVVKEARQNAQTGQGPPVLYLNAGDTYTGTAWFTIYKWKIAAEFLNALQPDAVSIGSNDFEYETGDVSPFLKNINTNIISSNIIPKSQQEIIQKNLIIDINGTKVGIVGYLALDNKNLTAEIEYIDEVTALRSEVAELKSQNVSIIIAVGHSNLEKDTEFATNVDGLDLVIAGQNNKLDSMLRSVDTKCPKAFNVTQESGRIVPVIPTCAYHKYLGKILVKFNGDGEIININSEPILLNSSIKQDLDAMEILKNEVSAMSTWNATVIGKTAVVLDGSSCKTAECNLGNLITDSITYYQATRFTGDSPWTDASIAVIPSGDIMGSIALPDRPADLSWGDLFSVIHGDNNLVAVTMSGSVLTQVLEHSLANYSTNNPTGQFLQVSGTRMVYDLSKDPGSRLNNAFVRCSRCWVPEFYVLENSNNYKVIMPASMAVGAYGYDMLNELTRETLSYDVVTSTADYIALRSPVYPEVAERVVLTNFEGVDDVGECQEGNCGTDNGGSEEDEELEETGNSSAASLTPTVLIISLLPFKFLCNYYG